MKIYTKLLISIPLAAGLLISHLTGYTQNRPQTFRIDKPDISRSQVPYPYITLNQFDTITITAGGCVQTGGHGKTWKRYINPIGPNAPKPDFFNPVKMNSLYISCFKIDGFTTGFQRLSDYIGRPYVMPANVNKSTFFLGYSDDDYSDNGYENRNDDNGTQEQCKGLGNAFVIVKIKRFQGK